MKLEELLRAGLFSAVVAASNGAYAAEAQVATPEQVTALKQTNDNATKASENNQEDWAQQKKLIEEDHATVLIKPAKNHPGFCHYGLDGFPQKYNLPADARTKDGKLEKAEYVLNLAETNPKRKFYFPCDLKADPETVTPKIVLVPGPAEVIEKEVPSVFVSAGAGYVQLLTEADEKYDFSGTLRGGKAFVTLHPLNTNWYFGSEAMVYGSQSSALENIEVPAKDGPLEGQLVMKGTNEYSLSALGMGLGLVGGYHFWDEEETGMSAEVYAGFMHDWITKELTEKSAHYINGKLVEGTDISNTTSDTESQWNVYHGAGLRLNLSDFCIIPNLGFRTNLSNSISPMGGLSVGYCPQ